MLETIASNRRAGYSIHRALCAASLLALLWTAPARAQEIEPREFIPLPAGTNINLLYYIHGKSDGYRTTSGQRLPGSNLEVNVGVERFVHFSSVGGLPAGWQLYQLAGSLSGRAGGKGLGSSVGASNTALSAFIWPYHDDSKAFVVAGFLYPPDGTYDKNKALTLASTLSGWQGWAGDIQLGWDHAVTRNFSYDAAADIRFFSDTTGPIQPGVPVSVRNHKDTDLRLQLWLNWAWTADPTIMTSIGYQGFFGGDTSFDNPLLLGGRGRTSTGSSREQRIRAALSKAFSQQLHVVLEANHDVDRTGGFKQDWGLTLRAAYIF